VRQIQISVTCATAYKMVVVQGIKNIWRSHILFGNVPVAIIRVAVVNICSMRIPKINDGEIIFEPVLTESRECNKKLALRHTQNYRASWFLKFETCCGTIRELGND
jgi:hypothetical protein